MPERKIKVGDTVVIRNGSSAGLPFKFDKVSKVGKTQFETGDKRKWMINSGHLVGSANRLYSDRIHFRITAHQARKENNDWIREDQISSMRRDIYKVIWRDISDDKIRRIKAILDEPKPRNK